MNRSLITRVGLSAICALIAAMWVYAFIFAPRESINKIGDTDWKARSQAACLEAENMRFAMQDLSEMKPNDVVALKKKADLVDRATNSLEAAINKIAVDIPADAKGKAIVPAWIADYRIYIKDRRAFAEALRTATQRPFFAETEVEGVPISERLGKFARENDMKACQPPLDLSV
jgi:hypothetical protein